MTLILSLLSHFPEVWQQLLHSSGFSPVSIAVQDRLEGKMGCSTPFFPDSKENSSLYDSINESIIHAIDLFPFIFLYVTYVWPLLRYNLTILFYKNI